MIRKKKLSKSFKINILICLTSIVFLLLLLEAFLRISMRNDDRGTLRIFDYAVHHKLRPNTTLIIEWEKGKKERYFTNSLGFRDRAIRKVQLASNGKRILFLGDSFTEGIGVKYEDSFVSKIEEFFRREDIDVEVLNAGIAGYSPILEYLSLKTLLESNIKLDLVMLMLDISDAKDQELYYETWYRGRSSSAIFRFKLLSLYNNYFSFRHLWHRLHKFNFEDQGIHNKLDKKGVSLLKRDILRIKDLLNSHRVTFVVVIFPWVSQTESEKKLFSDFETEMLDYCNANTIPIISLFTHFEQNSQWKELLIPGDVHWTTQGHAFVAEKLYAHFKEIGLIEKLKD